MDERAAIVVSLYRLLLNREPRLKELASWSERCPDLAAIPKMLADFARSREYVEKNGVAPGHPVGHYYSPVVNPTTLSLEKIRADRETIRSIPAVDLNLERQKAAWRHITAQTPTFALQAAEGERFYLDNPVYSLGDAVVLCGMIDYLRPRRIVEIGSGFSSACMLDHIDRRALETSVTFIEPYPERLKALLKPSDLDRHRLIHDNLQSVPLEEFGTLQPGDILFIDSTHVMKTGSDVNYELFEILPHIRDGVYVHFHDTFWPFEYPEGWIFGRAYSWNELYGLRAFLEYNTKFEIEFFSDAFLMLCREEVETAPEPARSHFLRSPGGAMWLRKGGE